MRLGYYFKVYRHFLSFMFKYMLSYRLNSLVRFTFFPTYTLAIFTVLQLIFGQTTSLGGWSQNETLLLFFTFHMLYGLVYILFMEGGVRHMMWSSVRTGEFDMILTKPINTQFLAMFSRPNIAPLANQLVVTGLWLHHISMITPNPSAWHLVLFLFIVVMSFGIIYFVLSSYATLSFYASKTQQVAEFFDKFADYSQYPTNIFPTSLQLLAFTIMPIAFFSYVPVTFLLGRGSLKLFAVVILILLTSAITNHFAWREGLKRYSSASS